MELIYHLGLVPGNDVTLQKVVYKCWAVSVLGILVFVALVGSLARRLAPLMSILLPAISAAGETYVVRVFWAVAAAIVAIHPMHVTISGDPIGSESAVVVCNHQSLADYFFLAYLAQSVDTVWTPQVNFFTWYALWRIPTFRVARNLVSCDENWDLSRQLCSAMFQRVMASPSPEWVVLFPEVNIRTPAVAYAQKVQSQKFFLPVYENVLYPRFPGLSNALSVVRESSKFSRLYDVTISFKKTPTLLDLFAAVDPICVDIHVRKVDLASVSGKRVRLEKWLETTWTEKDRVLDSLKQKHH